MAPFTAQGRAARLSQTPADTRVTFGSTFRDLGTALLSSRDSDAVLERKSSTEIIEFGSRHNGNSHTIALPCLCFAFLPPDLHFLDFGTRSGYFLKPFGVL